MMIGVYSTRRTLPSHRVTVPSVLFQSRMVSLPLLKVLLASLASWKTRTREVVVPLKYILYVPAGISSHIVSTFQVAANTLRHASGCRCYVIPDTNLSTVKAPHHVSGAGRSGIQNRKRARWPSWKPAGNSNLPNHVVFHQKFFNIRAMNFLEQFMDSCFFLYSQLHFRERTTIPHTDRSLQQIANVI